MLNVRSVTSSSSTPSISRTDSMIGSQCSWLGASIVMSRTSLPPSAFTMSIALTDPPASPIADVTSPSVPGSFSSSTRSVRLYEALGVTDIAPPRAALVAPSSQLQG
jgi:hypothetical protein